MAHRLSGSKMKDSTKRLNLTKRKLSSDKGGIISKKQEKLNEELRHAARIPNHLEIERLLKAGADISASGEYGTALHKAAEYGFSDTCALLFARYEEKGGDVKKLIEATDDFGRTALHNAAGLGDLKDTKTCELILRKYKEKGGDVKKLIETETSTWNNTALHSAAIEGNMKTCAFLLIRYYEEGGDVKKLIAKKGRNGTALEQAATYKKDKIVAFLGFMESILDTAGKRGSKSFIEEFGKCIGR